MNKTFFLCWYDNEWTNGQKKILCFFFKYKIETNSTNIQITTHTQITITHTSTHSSAQYNFLEGVRRTRSGRKAASTPVTVVPVRNTRRSTRKKSIDVSISDLDLNLHTRYTYQIGWKSSEKWVLIFDRWWAYLLNSNLLRWISNLLFDYYTFSNVQIMKIGKGQLSSNRFPYRFWCDIYLVIFAWACSF